MNRAHSLGSTVLLGIAIFPWSCPSADIFKSIDANGHVVYSDRRISENDQVVQLRSSGSSSESAQAQAAQELERLRRADEDRQQRSAAEKVAKEEKVKAAAERRDRCRRARDRYLMFAEANRLYRRDDKGERVYYTSAEIDAERDAAQQAMSEYCDGQPKQ